MFLGNFVFKIIDKPKKALMRGFSHVKTKKSFQFLAESKEELKKYVKNTQAHIFKNGN